MILSKMMGLISTKILPIVPPDDGVQHEDGWGDGDDHQDNDGDEQGDGPTEDGQDPAGVWEAECQDGDDRGDEWV